LDLKRTTTTTLETKMARGDKNIFVSQLPAATTTTNKNTLWRDNRQAEAAADRPQLQPTQIFLKN
jgi:hypothetical protein